MQKASRVTIKNLIPQGSPVCAADAISEQLWSRDDALTRIDSLPYPIFVPTTEYELVGLTPATVFMNSILFNGVEWMMHYGAADTVVGLATAQP